VAADAGEQPQPFSIAFGPARLDSDSALGTMNCWTIIPVAVLALLLACSRSQPTGSAVPKRVPSEITELGRPLSLREVRRYLTYDLTMDGAERLFGSPGSVMVSGFFYPQWSLDNSNVLQLWFSLDKARLEKAVLKNQKGDVLEVVLALR
jgi:hypothetical protein